jgi:PAS domain S-box-containing protein
MRVITHPGMARAAEVRRLRTLYQLLSALSRASTVEDVYDAALTSLLEATAADRAAILLFDDDGISRFKASRGLSPQYQAAVEGHSPWPRGARDAQPVVAADACNDAALARFQPFLESEHIRALVFLPLALDAGVFGKFMLYYAEPHEPPADELEIAQAIATHVALATEHKRAALERARGEQRLEAILDNSATVIFLKDLAGRYRLVNHRFEELFHIAKADAIGRTDRELFPPEIAAPFEANDRAVLAAGKPLVMEEYAPQADGVHAYLSTKFPFTGPDGAIAGVGGIATDITARKRLESAAQHLAAVVESSDDAIISKDLNGCITSWNQGAQRLFGYTAAEVLGQPVSILAAPDRRDEMPAILAKIRRGERVEHFETRRRKKNGEIVDVSLTVSPVRDSAGRIAGASKIARDITDRKAAERERVQLLAREQEARRTAELLNRVGPKLASQLDPERLAQEVVDVATALVDAESGAFFSNAGVLETARALDAFSGPPMPRDRELVGATLGGERVSRRDDAGRGAIRSFLAAPVVARSGEVLGGLFFSHSAPARFTANHEAIVAGIAAQAAIAMDNARLFEESEWVQAELKRSNEELRRANRDLEVFAYSASHDLKEPLRTMAISAQLIERSMHGELSGDDAASLANIVSAAKRMGALIDDLRVYTSATRYEEGLAPTIDTTRVLSNVIDNLSLPIRETNAVISAGDLPPVAMHAGRLGLLFQNLIANALKYRGEESPRVVISAAERDGWCVFSIADNGIGIPPEFAEQIFGLFKRLHCHEEYPGSGIGLAICKRIVEQYGGRIWLEKSASRQGSTFSFSVPARN